VADSSKHIDGDVKPIVKADSKIFNRVDAWAQMAAAEANGDRTAALSPRSGKVKPDDLEVDVGMKDRLGKWKSAEEGKKEEVGRTSPRGAKPADLEVDVGMKDRLGKWKSAEEGKSDQAPTQRKEPVKFVDDHPVEDVKARLNKWSAVTSEKPADSRRKDPVNPIVVTEETPANATAAPLRERLASYQRTVEEKEKSAPLAKNAKEEVAEAKGVSDRKNHWDKLSANDDGKSRASDASKEEVVATAPRLKDRLNAFNQATAEKTIEKAPVVVPYDDDYQPPQLPSEESGSTPMKREPVKVEGVSSLKDRLNSYEQAAVEKPLEKKAIQVEYEDDYVPENTA
jgi:hypothetical protein